MMLRSNVHTHCSFCDGANTPEEMVQAALRLGFTDLGFSSHSNTAFDPRCAGVQDEEAYRQEILHLREKYKGQLGILCGLETDTYAPTSLDYDYIIGSNHYFSPYEGRHRCVDSSPQELQEALQLQFKGDAMLMVADYYRSLVQGVRQQKPLIVGHFDLIAKFNEKGAFFDESSPAYQKIALEALREVLAILAPYGGMLEVNTGAMTRGYKSAPYPALFLLQETRKLGGRVIITSDSHSDKALNAFFDEALAAVKSAGIDTLCVLEYGKFVNEAI